MVLESSTAAVDFRYLHVLDQLSYLYICMSRRTTAYLSWYVTPRHITEGLISIV